MLLSHPPLVTEKTWERRGCGQLPEGTQPALTPTWHPPFRSSRALPRLAASKRPSAARVCHRCQRRRARPSGAGKVWSHPQRRSYSHLHGKRRWRGNSVEPFSPKGQPDPNKGYQTHLLSSAPYAGWFVIALTYTQSFVFAQAAMPPYGRWSLKRTGLSAQLLTAYEGIGRTLRSTYHSTKTSHPCWCQDLSTKCCISPAKYHDVLKTESKAWLKSLLFNSGARCASSCCRREGEGFGARLLPSSVKLIDTLIQLTHLQI